MLGQRPDSGYCWLKLWNLQSTSPIQPQPAFRKPFECLIKSRYVICCCCCTTNITEDGTRQSKHNVLCTSLHGGGGFQHVQYYSALKIMIDESPDEFGHVLPSSWKNMNYTTCFCSVFRRENRHTHTKCVCCHGQHISPRSFFLFGCFELQLVFKIAALPLFTRRSVMILCNRLLLIFSLSRCLHVFPLSSRFHFSSFCCKHFRVENLYLLTSKNLNPFFIFIWSLLLSCSVRWHVCCSECEGVFLFMY